MPVDPDPQQLPNILASLPANTPIVMLNLLRFRTVARYQDGDADYDGREAYRRYAREALGFVQSVGGEVIYAGAVVASVIAPEDESWDEMLLVRYPSADAFSRMLANPDYQKTTRHRSAALADSRLIATCEGGG